MKRLITYLFVSFLIALSVAILATFAAPVTVPAPHAGHLALAIGFLVLVLASIVALVRAVITAPHGTQDRTGFHMVLALALVALVVSSGGHGHKGHHKGHKANAGLVLPAMALGTIGFGLLGMDRFGESAVRARCRFFNQQHTDTFHPDALRDPPPAAIEAIADVVLAMGPTVHRCNVPGCYRHDTHHGNMVHVIDLAQDSPETASYLAEYYNRRADHYCGD